MLEYIKNLEFGDMANWIAFISIVVTIYIGMKSIKIAEKALEHSQKSLVVNESHKPIINDIKKNRSVRLRSSQLLDLSETKIVKEGYIFDALEKDWKQRINEMLEIVNRINETKRQLDSIASNAISKVFNEYIEKTDYKEEVGKVEYKVDGSKGNLYDLIMENNLYFLMVDSHCKPDIHCEIWVEHISLYPDGLEIPIKEPKYIMDLDHVIQKYMDVELNPNDELPEFDIEKLEKQIVKYINEDSKHIIMENEYKELIAHFDQLQNEINIRIKELIIPGFKKRKWKIIRWPFKNEFK